MESPIEGHGAARGRASRSLPTPPGFTSRSSGLQIVSTPERTDSPQREAFLVSPRADTIPVMPTRTIPLSDRDLRLSDLADRANEFRERFILTGEGEARAALLAAQDPDGLLETLDVLSDSELVQRLVTAEAELAHGGGHSLDDVREGIRSGRGSTFQSG